MEEDSPPPTMSRWQSEVLQRPSSIPKTRSFNLHLPGLPEPVQYEQQSGTDSSRRCSGDEGAAPGDDIGLTHEAREARRLIKHGASWSEDNSYNENFPGDPYGGYGEDAELFFEEDDEDDGYGYGHGDYWDPRESHDDLQGDRVEDVARETRRCHSLTDLDHLE
eukprot:CAMPEP_0113685172 /NCGR_PEP_ID=MMETSP0038_2-20120614/14496_1 /TAXON_ID=2898 /ORGANISM="Cryptomonas paramecium" /LENGTH=163 /DNA_ID=CAMNT_0000605173 /DNA_START=250 /DNA_END=738 /DNA_ORIENTATION=- /assembly_acc=CAM_ASM_000170